MGSNILLAMLFGIGVYLVVIGLFSSKTTERTRSIFAEKQADGEVAENKIFRAMAADLGARLSPEKGNLAELLVKSGGVYRSPEEFYTRQMYSAIVHFFLVLIIAFFFGMSVTVSSILLTVGAVYGFGAPKRALNKAINARRERLLKEMGFGLERIATSLTSGAEMAEALNSARKVGMFGEICLHLANQMVMQRPIKDVVEEVRASLPETPEMNEFLEMVKIGMAKGTDVTPVFRTIADNMRSRLRLEVTKAGQRAKNNIAAITSGMTIFAVFAVVLGPLFLAFFQNGGIF